MTSPDIQSREVGVLGPATLHEPPDTDLMKSMHIRTAILALLR